MSPRVSETVEGVDVLVMAVKDSVLLLLSPEQADRLRVLVDANTMDPDDPVLLGLQSLRTQQADRKLS